MAMFLDAAFQSTILIFFPLTLLQPCCNIVTPSFPAIFVASSGQLFGDAMPVFEIRLFH